MIHVIFDIDDTLAKVVNQEENFAQVPDYDLIQVMRWFINNGDKVYAWSGSGVDYAKMWIRKLGFVDSVKIIPKIDLEKKHPKMDIAFDDCEHNLAKTTVIVKRTRENRKTI